MHETADRTMTQGNFSPRQKCEYQLSEVHKSLCAVVQYQRQESFEIENSEYQTDSEL